MAPGDPAGEKYSPRGPPGTPPAKNMAPGDPRGPRREAPVGPRSCPGRGCIYGPCPAEASSARAGAASPGGPRLRPSPRQRPSGGNVSGPYSLAGAPARATFPALNAFQCPPTPGMGSVSGPLPTPQQGQHFRPRPLPTPQQGQRARSPLPSPQQGQRFRPQALTNAQSGAAFPALCSCQGPSKRSVAGP